MKCRVSSNGCMCTKLQNQNSRFCPESDHKVGGEGDLSVAVDTSIQSREAAMAARTRTQGMIKGGFGRRAHVDMRMRSAHPRSDAGATPLRTLSAPAWHWQHTRHVRFGRERGRVLSYRFAAAHLAGPQLRDIDLPIDLSHGRAANRATAVPFGRWWTGRPIPGKLPGKPQRQTNT